MGNTYPLIGLDLVSLRDFQDRVLANSVINKINEYGKAFIPQKYDVYQPLKRKFNSNDISGVVDLWMNEGMNQQTYDDGYAGGLLLMESKKGSKASYMVNWQKDNTANFNLFTLSIDIDYISNCDNYNMFIKLCYELIGLIQPVYGMIVNKSYSGWDEPINLRVRLPELHWLNFFGKPYIDLFGEDKLLCVPAYKTENIGVDVIAIQTIENVLESIPNKVREEIKRHLGENAFVWDGKRALVYQHKENLTPSFDFSNVLFDKSKPIIEPQIRTKKKD